jgi:flagellar basal body-associated protein FliL
MDLYLGIVAVIVIIIVALVSYYMTKGKKKEAGSTDFSEKKEEMPMPSQTEEPPIENPTENRSEDNREM